MSSIEIFDGFSRPPPALLIKILIVPNSAMTLSTKSSSFKILHSTASADRYLVIIVIVVYLLTLAFFMKHPYGRNKLA